MWVTSSTTKVLSPNAIALGNFDGIHRGHQKVVQPILQYSKTGENQSNSRVYTTIVTFNPHPQEFFTGKSRKLLTPLPEKIQQLERLGVDQLILLPFDRELAALSPEKFVSEILVKQLQTRQISVGQDFRFGYQRAGNSLDLQAIAANFEISTTITDLQNCQEGRISSSLIRQALIAGDIAQANRLLGRSYTLTGKVVKGKQLGRTIGFPTANLEILPSKFLPRYGVYVVRVTIYHTSAPNYLNWQEAMTVLTPGQYTTADGFHLMPDLSYPQPHLTKTWGVMNIGDRPTVAGTSTTVEVHLFDWFEDLYGKTITVSLEQFLRPEQKFASLDDLKNQILTDCEQAKQLIVEQNQKYSY